MFDNVNNDLFLEALAVATAAAFIVRRDLPWILAAVVIAVRLCVPLVYFTHYSNDPWRLSDDLGYFADGLTMLDQGYNPLTALFTCRRIEALQGARWRPSYSLHVVERHGHVLVWPALFCSRTAQCAGHVRHGAMLRRTAAVLGFPAMYGAAFQVFYLLHWDVISWSSFMNLKDSIVQFLTVTVLYLASRFFQRRDWQSVLGFIAVLPVFYLIRFYVPFLVMLATTVWIAVQWRDNLKYLLVPLVLLAVYFALPLLSGVSDLWNFEDALFGAVRLLITPLPWRLGDDYSFLEVSSVCHLLFLLPTMIGFLALWWTNRQARLYLIYFCIVVGLYAITDELQGPRHRFQIAFIFAWTQFHFLWMLKPAPEPQARALAMNPAPGRQPLRTMRPATIGS